MFKQGSDILFSIICLDRVFAHNSTIELTPLGPEPVSSTL
jgi:hypothetical protein